MDPMEPHFIERVMVVDQLDSMKKGLRPGFLKIVIVSQQCFLRGTLIEPQQHDTGTNDRTAGPTKTSHRIVKWVTWLSPDGVSHIPKRIFRVLSADGDGG